MNKILVTGGSKGIGLECVKRFVSEGWHVICCSRNSEIWKEQVNNFPELKEVEYYACDVSNKEDVATMFNSIENKHSRIDAAVNNASPAVKSLGKFKDVDLELLRETLDDDLWSTILCLKHEIDITNEGGSIVNITSINGLRPTPGASMYGAAKQAIESLTKSIALEAVEDKIRVNSVAPGVTWTPRWEERNSENPGIREDVEDAVPIKRFATANEIANCVSWLISDEASYVVGHTLVVDGGLSLK